MAIDVELLKKERAALKDNLRELEGQQRKLESELKGLRQNEIRLKREIEALSTLIEINDPEEKESAEAAKADA